MIFLDYLQLANSDDEIFFLHHEKKTCFDSFYPFQIFPQKRLTRVDFSDITILYGGNGSGKSTLLNVLAGSMEIQRDAIFNQTNFFGDYLKMCKVRYEDRSFAHKEILTSDGVFDAMLDLRNLNQGIDRKREKAFEDYLRLKQLNAYDAGDSEELQRLRRNPMANLDKLRRMNISKNKSMSEFVRRTVADNVREHSNGESAYEYFANKITRDGIYLLDEPENSLSPANQLKLVQLIQESVRYFNCQFVIATHSPFVLSLEGAKIYDLDTVPVDIRKWTDLPSVRAYYDFFKFHEDEFAQAPEQENNRRYYEMVKMSPARKVLYQLLDSYDLDEEVQDDISSHLETDLQIMDFIDEMDANITAGMGRNSIRNKLYELLGDM